MRDQETVNLLLPSLESKTKWATVATDFQENFQKEDSYILIVLLYSFILDSTSTSMGR